MTSITKEQAQALLEECDSEDCLTCEYARTLLACMGENARLNATVEALTPPPDFEEGAAIGYAQAVSDLTQLRANNARLVAECDALAERVKVLERVLRNRDGGSHDEDCKARRYAMSDGLCNCGHDETVAALKETAP